MKTIEKLELLIRDKWGHVTVNRDGAQPLFQVVCACYEKRSLILTTNPDFSKWVSIFHDGTMTTTMISRLVHRAIRLALEGRSYRMNALVKCTNKSTNRLTGGAKKAT